MEPLDLDRPQLFSSTDEIEDQTIHLIEEALYSSNEDHSQDEETPSDLLHQHDLVDPEEEQSALSKPTNKKPFDISDMFEDLEPLVSWDDVDQEVRMVATGMVGYGICYFNVQSPSDRPLDHSEFLAQSDETDSLTCCLVADLNSDGHNELLLGSYSGDVLVYGEQDVSTSVARHNNFQPKTPDLLSLNADEQDDEERTYEFKSQLSFSQPLNALGSCDLTNEGVQSIVVCSLFGLHVLQPSLDQIRLSAIEGLRTLEEIRNTETEFEQALLLRKRLKVRFLPSL